VVVYSSPNSLSSMMHNAQARMGIQLAIVHLYGRKSLTGRA